MSAEQRDYQLLHKISRSIYTLQGISSLLDWDQETYMPEGAAANRAEQRELIAGLTHQKRTSSAFANALARLVNLDTGSLRALGLSEPQNAALKEWRRDYLRERVLPKRFVEKFAKLSSEAIQVWKHAREKNDFKSFVPYLEQIVAYNQKKQNFWAIKLTLMTLCLTITNLASQRMRSINYSVICVKVLPPC